MNRAERLRHDGVVGEPVLFYRPRDAYGWASNFSRHSVRLDLGFGLRTYTTGEHAYQAAKTHDEFEHSWVAESPTPLLAKERGRKVSLRNDWGNSYGDACSLVMFQVVLHKAMQHDLLRELRGTGTRHIYEDSPTDDIWGWRFREDYRGKNLLGRAWMDVRRCLFDGVSLR